MDNFAITATGLTKHYGHIEALNDLDMHVDRGEVFGYLGPNGAGKTTTMRLLLGLLRPTRGSASILGMDIQSQRTEACSFLSYLSSDDSLYDYMTGQQYLDTFARLSGRRIRQQRELIERLDLDVSHTIRSLSSGNRQKVGIVRALQVDVPLYLLDEPTRGLDPLVQQEFGQIVREYRDEGRTIFLSTHILSEAELLCDRVGILRTGRLVTVETLTGLVAAQLRRFTVRFGDELPSDADLPGALSVERRGHEVSFEVRGSTDTILKALARYEVTDLATDEPSLEEAFLRFYGEEAAT